MKLKPLNTSTISRNNLFDNKIKQVTDFLKEHYSIEINQFNPSQIRIISKSKKYKLPSRISINDISLHLRENDIAHSKNLLRDIILSPNQVDVFNPIEEYFNKIKGTYNGVSHIDLLLSHLTPKDFSDKKKGYYVERMIKLFRKWIVATVACAIRVKPNDVQLIFIMEAEGTGKTFLSNFLCPDDIRNMFKESSKDKKVFQFSDAFANNFLVLFDEMVGLNNFTAEQFKSTMSAKNIELKFRYNDIPIVVPRIASAIGTTNNKTGHRKGFLTPALGYRRFGCIHLDKINLAYSDKINIDNLWAEALTLFEGGFNYTWDQEDFEDFADYNGRYLVETEAHSLISAYFEKPLNGEGTWMQPKEILEELLKKKAINKEQRTLMTPEKIGEALTGLGFKRTSKHIAGVGSRRAYFVKFL